MRSVPGLKSASKWMSGLLVVCVGVVGAFLGAKGKAPLPAGPTNEQKQNVHAVMQRLPLTFQENRGQAGGNVKFLTRGAGYTFWMSPTSTTLALAKLGGAQAKNTGGRQPASVVRMRMVGADKNARISGAGAPQGHTNYLIGPDSKKWVRDIPNFSKVRYDEIYPGIDLEYYGNQQELEHDFIVSPGTDPKAIRLAYDGTTGVKITADGELHLETPNGVIEQKKPVSYQTVDGKRRPVESRYTLLAKNEIAFEVGDYDQSKPLVIDPVLRYCTFVGGSHDDYGFDIAIDADRNVYVTGYTGSYSQAQDDRPGALPAGEGGARPRIEPLAPFPTANPLMGDPDSIFTQADLSIPSNNSIDARWDYSYYDAFVFKLNNTGSGLVFSTYLGASGDDYGLAIAVDNNRNPYITGRTLATNWPLHLPVQGDAAGADAFVVKLSAAGNSLAYSTYLGGSGDDFGRSIAVDATGNAHVAGFTTSTDLPTFRAAQPALGGGRDIFVTSLDASGSAYNYSTYLGGAGDEGGASGSVSLDYTAPNTPYQVNLPAPFAGFVFPFNTADLLGTDYTVDLAVDPQGNAYVTGGTTSTEGSGFPVTAGVVGPTHAADGGGFDAFVTSYLPDGVINYSTFLGGTSDDAGRSIALNAAGEAFVTGYTLSTNFPLVLPALQDTNHGGADAFVVKLDNTGTGLIYSTYLGGALTDIGNGIAVSEGGQAYVAGSTTSSSAGANGFPTENFFQANVIGGSDAFVSKLRPNGLAFEFSTYLGGSSADRAMSIVLDVDSQSYITGITGSSNLPTAQGSMDRGINTGTTNPSLQNYGPYPNADAFVAKFHAPPFAPSDLIATDVQLTSVSIAWTDQSDNEDGFEIERKLGGGPTGTWTVIQAVGRNQVTFTNNGLIPTTTYSYRVRPFNDDGTTTYYGPYSNQLVVTTLPAPPASPTNFRATALDTQRIQLDWTDAANNEESYVLERRIPPVGVFAVINGGNPLPGSAPPSSTGTGMTFTDTGLSSNTTYEYRLRSRNVAGDSPAPFPTAQATTLAPAPVTLPVVTATAVSNSAIDVTWTYGATPPDHIGFKIYRKGPGDTLFLLIRTTSNQGTTFADTGLTANSEYCYRVLAYNASGDGPLSNPPTGACATTLPDPPAAPTDLTATLQPPTGVELNWTDNSTGPEEFGFKIEASTDNFNTTATTSIAADAGAGDGAVTVASAVGIAPGILIRVGSEIMSVTGVSGTTVSVLRGQLGSSAAGHMTGAVVTVGAVQLTTEAPSNAGTGAVSPFNLASLLHNTVYYFRVLSFARNMGGDSDSAPSNVACIITRPAAPLDFVLIVPAPAAGSTSIVVGLLDGNPLTNTPSTFRVERAPETSPGSMTPGAFATIGPMPTGTQGGQFFVTDTGLSSNARYFYRVTATNLRPGGCVDPNSGGDSATLGPKSALTRPATATMGSVTPISLADPVFVPGTTGLRIVWTGNSTNPSVFRIERSTDSFANPINTSVVHTTNVGDPSSWDDLGTLGNSRYYYRVVAFNATGDALSSSVGNALTLPARPTNVAANASTDPGAPAKIQVDITWTDASFAPTAFQVEMSSTGPGGAYSPVAGSPTVVGATSLRVRGLEPGTSYCFRVRGVNASGGGEWSVITCPPVGPTGLTAQAISESEIVLTWEDRSDNESDFRIDRVNGNSFATGTNPTNFTVGGPNITTYTDSGLTPNTTYTYRVTALSPNGNSAPSREAGATTFRTPPVNVSGLMVQALSSSQIQLDWTHGGANVTGFKIERKEEPAGSFAVVTTAGPALRTYTDTGRKSNTTYTYRVTATNMGSEPAMPPTGSALTYPATPTGLAVSSVSSTQLDLTWNDNSSTPSDFKIERKEEPAGSFALIATTTAPAATYQDATGLSPNTTYTYRVTATNATGDSAPSNEASGMTLPNPPTTPSGVMVLTVSQSSLRVNWTDASNNETGFKIERSPTGMGGWQQVGATGMNTQTFLDQGLLAGTTYFYRVIATNTGGDSAPSTVASGTTLPNPPAAPSGLTVTVPAAPAGASQLVLNWNDNSNNETGFKVERSTDNFGAPANTTLVTTTAAGATTYTNTGLAADTIYYYRVRATNAAGDSGNSNVANGRTLPVAPAAPSALTVTPLSSTSLRIDWTDNSANEDSFKLERSPDGVTFNQIATPVANSTSYTDSGLTADTEYHYRVRASNTGGDSGYSNVDSGTTFPLPPVAPSNLVVTVVSSTSLKLDWTDNSSNETSFKIQRKVMGGTFAAAGSVGQNVKTFTDTGLQPDTAYTYRVFSSHGGGDSTPSNEASGTTLPSPPSAPTSLTATALSQTEIRLDWTAASNNETGFKIERSTDGTNFSPAGMVSMDVLTFTDTGRTANTTYTYRVKATNAGGDSAPSPTASATTLPNPPAAPANLVANAVSGTVVQLSWVDNSSGGSSETGFSVERKEAGGVFAVIAQTGVNFTTHQDNGLTPGVTYVYRVRAFNAGGNSAYTNEATVGTTPTPPDAPTAVSVTALSKSSLRFTWADNSSNEANFVIERKTGNGSFGFLVNRGANTTSYDDTGLTANTTYSYRVQAVNGGGSSVFSSELSGTTLPEAPAAPTNLRVAVHSLTEVGLAWNDNSDNETGFRIERRVGANKNDPFVELALVGADVESYVDTDVDPNQTYAYRVFATNQGGDSAPTDQVAVTVTGGGRLKVSVARVSFPKTTVGKSKTKTFRVKNTGTGPLLGSIGSADNPFSVTGGGAFSLAPGQSKIVSVKFTPIAAGRSTRALTITSTDSVRPNVSVSLTGLGAAAARRR
ncbi:MAG: fibronectin type III domain-containing protein [Actinomycetota bacterium]